VRFAPVGLANVGKQAHRSLMDKTLNHSIGGLLLAIVLVVALAASIL